ncbi:hypothetical protein FZ025_06195 [Xanthomonas hyacinthi]|uniref:Uncharacterized protein n=1 Tax=Xanthomonas hyacinthi TaxID=56455 RepID=A0A2S7EUG2_9XANT|nr:hypothetical protein [Xanthomonas hyacinthi]KLD78413.1 hypothetical protein Y886_10190 [Xanthomonas hyacinthi DSM 19077]PPU96773.1 hypothetical protein XhyaCFBP1156_13460 [Xanthomonas hyacinthi]QGY76278.1 hypothetical protein FZ025_06195 [Xanthomonas hyacinthi]
MSKQSKARRDKRKKQQPKRGFARLGREQPIANHAVLQDDSGRVLAAIGLQGSEWLLSVGGQTMGNADNPVPMLAMLKHLASVQEQEGTTITLDYSTQLQQMIDDLAADEGKTAAEYLDALVAEFAEGDDDAAEEEDGVADAGDDAADADAAADTAGSDAARPAADAEADADGKRTPA